MTSRARWQFVVYAALVASALASCAASSKAVDVVMSMLALAALMSPTTACQSMSLAIVIKYLNPEIAEYGAVSGLLFWVVLIAGTVRLLSLVRPPALPLVIPIWAFGLIALILSCMVSPSVPISVLKVITFVLVTTAVLASLQAVTAIEIQRIRTFLFALVTTVAAASAITVAQPAIGYALVKTNLQGILNHPQTLATFLAPFVAWAMTGLLVNRRPGILATTFLLLTCAVMLMTLARTAVIANVVGVGCALIARTLSGKSHAQLAAVGRTLALSTAAIITIITLAFTVDSFRSAVTGFVLKREAENVDQAFYSSRGFGIQSQWKNFLAQPLTGHGFGVYADGSFPDGIVEFNGIPISAPVEKGFIPTAVLEETGLLGGVVFLILIVTIARFVLKATDVRWIAVFFTSVTVNVGEAVLLSPGGIGLHIWLLISLAAAAHRLPEEDETHAAAAGSDTDDIPIRARFSNLMR